MDLVEEDESIAGDDSEIRKCSAELAIKVGGFQALGEDIAIFGIRDEIDVKV